MPSTEIDEFARVLVQCVRDAAVRSCDALMAPHALSFRSQRWKALQASPALLNEVIPDVVDDVIFCLLHAIDNGDIPLKFVSGSGREVDLAEEGMGELAGWYLGNGGWVESFSVERHFDVLADQDD